MIDLDSSVTNYIDWFKPQYKGTDAVVTVRHLMDHSSGIPVWTISEGDGIARVSAIKRQP